MTETADFHELRRTGLGGSDAAAAIGISPWRTPYDLWCEKTGEAEPLPASEPMLWGTLLEPVIAAEYCRRTGHQIQLAPPMLRHPTHNYMLAHIDGRVDNSNSRILECKTARTAAGWGETGSDEIPLQYSAQVHHCLVVSGARIADVAVLIGGQDFRLYQVLADPEIARELVEQEYMFWQHVQNREPPDPVNTADAVRRWGSLTAAGTVVAGETELFAFERLQQIRSQKKHLESEQDEAELKLMQALGEEGDHLVDEAGTLLATWKMDRGRKPYSVSARDPKRRFLLKGDH
jgi:putative phage-type endonuclease